jgi:hypothetical protein
MEMNRIAERLKEKCSDDELWWLYTDLKFHLRKNDKFREYLSDCNTCPTSAESMLNSLCGRSFQFQVTPIRCDIKRVIFNPPATIILWNDGTKTVVKCQNGEHFDAEKGFALAYLKKLLGNDNTFNKEIHKWVE